MKNLLLILIFIFTSTLAYSQFKVRPGVKAGLNFSDLSNVENSSTKTGLNVGIFVNLHLTHFYELQVEAGFSSQGSSINSRYWSDGFDPIISSNSIDYELNYATLAVANKFFPFKGVGVNFIVGPGLDILVSNNNYDYITPIDLSFFGGIGYEFPFGLGLELRYKQGIVEVRENYIEHYDTNYYYYDNSVLNSVIQIGATYKFNF